MSEVAVWQCTICGRFNNPTHTVCAPCGSPRVAEQRMVESAVSPPSQRIDFDFYDFPVGAFTGVGIVTTVLMGVTSLFGMFSQNSLGPPSTLDLILGICFYMSLYFYPIQVPIIGIFQVLHLDAAYPTPKHLLGIVTLLLYVPVMSLAPYLWMRGWWAMPTAWLDICAALVLNAIAPTVVARVSLFITKRLLAWHARRKITT